MLSHTCFLLQKSPGKGFADIVLRREIMWPAWVAPLVNGIVWTWIHAQIFYMLCVLISFRATVRTCRAPSSVTKASPHSYCHCQLLEKRWVLQWEGIQLSLIRSDPGSRGSIFSTIHRTRMLSEGVPVPLAGSWRKLTCLFAASFSLRANLEAGVTHTKEGTLPILDQ